MRINTNVSAMNTYGRLTQANASKSGSLAKLSSGLRINKAGDDAAGLAISEKMKAQIGGLKQATRNAQDGISLIQTAEGALNETHSILGRMRDLAVQSTNGTLTNDDRTELNKEFTALTSEIDRISQNTEFNTMKLLDGSNGGTGKFDFQVGANANQTISVTINKMDKTTLGGVNAAGTGSGTDAYLGGQDLLTAAKAGTAIVSVDEAIKSVSSQRSDLGAVQNRLEHTVNNLTTTQENLSEANSRIRDVDMAEEMMSFTKSNILSQASTSMLAQANAMPQSVLSLLQG
ncbi:flagellin [Enterococcus lemanii]|uniref:Flagellin n=1 Tax=Enterococcus lemanii TaxID=1159752 RepID=A0ABV9MV17_9ENTE|nr:flagellin [Enterococcus lemanii]MBM7708093.1 flagellin [Enterococcus lemanii]